MWGDSPPSPADGSEQCVTAPQDTLQRQPWPRASFILRKWKTEGEKVVFRPNHRKQNKEKVLTELFCSDAIGTYPGVSVPHCRVHQVHGGRSQGETGREIKNFGYQTSN